MQLSRHYSSYIATVFVFVIITVINVCFSQQQTVGTVSLTNSLVWGPGLDVDFVVPVRYFYVQPVDTDGYKYALYSQSNVYVSQGP